MKFKELTFVHFDSAGNFYELEFEKTFLRVDAADHPQAEEDEHYFDDKDLVNKLIKEATEDDITEK